MPVYSGSHGLYTQGHDPGYTSHMGLGGTALYGGGMEDDDCYEDSMGMCDDTGGGFTPATLLGGSFQGRELRGGLLEPGDRRQLLGKRMTYLQQLAQQRALAQAQALLGVQRQGMTPVQQSQGTRVPFRVQPGQHGGPPQTSHALNMDAIDGLQDKLRSIEDTQGNPMLARHLYDTFVLHGQELSLATAQRMLQMFGELNAHELDNQTVRILNRCVDILRAIVDGWNAASNEGDLRTRIAAAARNATGTAPGAFAPPPAAAPAPPPAAAAPPETPLPGTRQLLPVNDEEDSGDDRMSPDSLAEQQQGEHANPGQPGEPPGQPPSPAPPSGTSAVQSNATPGTAASLVPAVQPPAGTAESYEQPGDVDTNGSSGPQLAGNHSIFMEEFNRERLRLARSLREMRGQAGLADRSTTAAESTGPAEAAILVATKTPAANQKAATPGFINKAAATALLPTAGLGVQTPGFTGVDKQNAAAMRQRGVSPMRALDLGDSPPPSQFSVHELHTDHERELHQAIENDARGVVYAINNKQKMEELIKQHEQDQEDADTLPGTQAPAAKPPPPPSMISNIASVVGSTARSALHNSTVGTLAEVGATALGGPAAGAAAAAVIQGMRSLVSPPAPAPAPVEAPAEDAPEGEEDGFVGWRNEIAQGIASASSRADIRALADRLEAGGKHKTQAYQELRGLERSMSKKGPSNDDKARLARVARGVKQMKSPPKSLTKKRK